MKGMYMDMMGIIRGILGWIAQEIWRHFMMKDGRKAWEKACRDISTCKKSNLSPWVMRDDTCADMGNEYKDSNGSRTRDISVGLKIIQLMRVSKCLKATERKWIWTMASW